MRDEAQSFAPGRVEILGNYTDLIGGDVLAAPLDRGVSVVARRERGTGEVRCRSSRMNDEYRCDLGSLVPDPERPWTRYVLGVLGGARQVGCDLGSGLELDIQSTLSPGAGLASSAALTVALSTALTELCELTVSGLELARLCQRVEHLHAGVACGLLDPLCASHGAHSGVMHLDLGRPSVESVAWPVDALLILIRSRVRRNLAESPYSKRRIELETARIQLGCQSLRQLADQHGAEAIPGLDSLPEPYQSRARHVISEQQRVTEAIRVVAAGDLDRLGILMLESHESSRLQFENSCVELDCLVELARLTPGCFGARLTGAGFGGAMLSLVDRTKLDVFRTTMTREVLRQFGFPPDFLIVAPA